MHSDLKLAPPLSAFLNKHHHQDVILQHHNSPMDEFLALVGVQAMNYAIRSGITLTSTYALGQCSRLLESVEDRKILAELKSLRKLLDTKIKVDLACLYFQALT